LILGIVLVQDELVQITGEEMTQEVTLNKTLDNIVEQVKTLQDKVA
jgi:hypothetical protein